MKCFFISLIVYVLFCIIIYFSIPNYSWNPRIDFEIYFSGMVIVYVLIVLPIIIWIFGLYKKWGVDDVYYQEIKKELKNERN